MAYSTLPSFSAGVPLTAVQMNLVRSNFEETAKAPMGWCYSTANQTVNNGTGPVMTFAATYALRNVSFASNSLTLAEAGHYLTMVHVAWGAGPLAGIRVLNILLNGVSQAAEHDTPNVSNWSQQTLFYPVICAAGSVISASVFQDSGAAVTLNSGSSLWVHMMSRL